MGVPSANRMDVVRVMIQTSPDSVIRQLDLALKGAAAGEALAVVCDMIDTEVSDRGLRRLVFAPIMPLCAPRADGFEQIRLPAAAIALLWRALKDSAPRLVMAAANDEGIDPGRGQTVPPAYDKLCLQATGGLQGDDPAFAQVRALLDSTPGGALQMAGYLQLTPLARQALRRLPGWINRMDDQAAAAVRLAFRDAVAIAEDAAPRLAEIFLAHLADPWTVVRLICAVTKRGGEAYVASSELAGFCERIMADIDTQLAVLRRFDPQGGVEAARAATGAVSRAVAARAEFEGNLELDRSGAWGQRTARQKSALADLVEGHLRHCGKLVGEALPLHPSRSAGPGLPPLNPVAVDRALAALTFLDLVRPAAPGGGYASARTRIAEELIQGLDAYLEDLLLILRADDPDQAQTARAYLAVLADFMALVDGEKAGRLVRRRTASA